MAGVLLTETPGGDPFAEVAAGPVLAAVLAEVVPAALSGQHAAAFMRAAARQRNHDDAVLLRALQQACRARADTVERVHDGQFAPGIAAAGLGWSETMASTRYMLADHVFDRVPALGEAMDSGYLEERKAAIFASATEGLDDAQCARVVQIVLPEAGGLGYAALRERILEVARAVDPDWAAARLAAAVAAARVSARTAPSGAVDLTGHDLPPDLAQDAKLHLDALAGELRTRLVFLGSDIGLGFIRARLFLRLLDGTLAGADDHTVLDAVFTELCSGIPRDPGDGPPDEPDGPGPDDPGPDDPGPDDPGPDDGPTDDGTPDDTADGPRREPDDPGPDDGSGATGRDREPDEPVPAVLAHRRGVSLRMRLSTLLGLDDHPGAFPELGGTPAASARRAAAELGAATWHVLVHDEHGTLRHLLVLRAPPHCARNARHRRRTVEITAPAALLDALLEDAPAEPWLAALLTAYQRSRDLPPDQHPATTTRDRDRRLPGAALARWIDARDERCIAPGCRALAARCDHDHTLDHHLGGPTQADGLGNLCRHDHRAKHEGGWHYHQPEPGRFVVTDPTGTVHHTGSRVTHPLPDPVAAETPVPRSMLEHRPAPERPDYTARPTRDGHYTPQSLATAAHLA
ncbi:HNH endonuclease signature motif containing protein [Actinomycetospora sp. OC33-EN08]|uniref:HNH endonuclease signature motif containing protein n=1 Tax=Actinomycetospora aurantiaca TaxID=3129233 RepID=A0ABU8MWA3_9PSEU